MTVSSVSNRPPICSGLTVASTKRAHAAANEMQQVMVVQHFRILSENAALFRLRQVRLEGQHAIAASKTEQIVQALERLFEGRLC